MIEGLAHCLRHEKTSKESQHLLAFALLHTKQNKLAAAAFFKSIKLGNETDWQPLVEVSQHLATHTLQANRRADKNAHRSHLTFPFSLFLSQLCIEQPKLKLSGAASVMQSIPQ